MNDEKKNYRTGMISAFCCMAIWGFMPVYWNSLVPIDRFVIILYRIVLSAAVSFFVALKAYGWNEVMAPLKQRTKVFKLIIAGILIVLNWTVNIYGVHTGRVIETSIGFYMDPLMICVFGIVLFKERPTKYKIAAMLCAFLGVLIILVRFGRLPWIALSIAMTFSLYAALKKHLKMKAAVSIFYETLFLIPPALIAIVYLELNGKGAFGAAQPYQLALLFLIGVITGFPLFLFSVAANRISMISLGIIEYIAPTMILLLGIFLFKEPFDPARFAAFAAIWAGLAVFTFGEIKNHAKNKSKV